MGSLGDSFKVFKEDYGQLALPCAPCISTDFYYIHLPQNCIMKNRSLILGSILLLTLFSFGQNIPPAPQNKAVVYFVRTSSLGFAINFSYFDSASFLGKTSGTNYVRYELEPGRHLLWARSENRSFVEAELDAGKIYFLEVTPEMGAIKAEVDLRPVHPNTDEKVMKRILKLMDKKQPSTFTPEELKDINSDIINKGLDKYREDKEKGKKIPKLENTANYISN
jgi:hypothetical protein